MSSDAVLLSEADALESYPSAIHLPIESILPHYNSLLLAYGSTRSRSLGIPGSPDIFGRGGLRNVHSSLDFVHWYNGHPAAHDVSIGGGGSSSGAKHMDLTGVQKLSIIGAGNVALDVARIVLRAPTALSIAGSSEKTSDPTIDAHSNPGKELVPLRKSDIPEPVLAHLSSSRVRKVDIFARRGPAQLACTTKELREMMTLWSNAETAHVRFEGVREKDKLRGLEGLQALQRSSSPEYRAKKRMLELLWADEASKSRTSKKKSFKVPKNEQQALHMPSSPTHQDPHSAPTQAASQWALNFWHTPKSFESRLDAEDRVGSIRFSVGDGQKEVPKDISTDFVVTSVGYLGAPLLRKGKSEGDDAERSSSIIPWDSRKGVVPNEGGRVVRPAVDGSKIVPGLYVSGWLARGPVGVIASTMYDANSVADLILSDWAQRLSSAHDSDATSPDSLLAAPGQQAPDLPRELRESSRPFVDWNGWQRIDGEELRRGQELGKLREKILTVDEMLRVAVQ
ncbi:FAD/NAD(P)-binding domain-containing protein [Ceraceosorus guamensis]|uniref:FAD/NAD(P)-binding domain-containing protein n=1 Tax=Ceraceosorus guamensis TaxID=1522189 RepID=A0A316VNY8_9BASI|nr:FAD/NAD(P)-binding domain-containing protein [Ceraceosorus guamensis]PWN39287.1 FAD/NAD(P)-binding domain-containing protein [Ceraceosorus guamensis]